MQERRELIRGEKGALEALCLLLSLGDVYHWSFECHKARWGDGQVLKSLSSDGFEWF